MDAQGEADKDMVVGDQFSGGSEWKTGSGPIMAMGQGFGWFGARSWGRGWRLQYFGLLLRRFLMRQKIIRRAGDNDNYKDKHPTWRVDHCVNPL